MGGRTAGARAVPRRTALTGGLAGALALTACAPEEVAETGGQYNWDRLGESLDAVPEAGVLWEPVPEGAGSGMETSAGRYALVGTYRTDRITPSQAAGLGHGGPGLEEDLLAPEGETFHFFTLDLETLSWSLTLAAQRPSVRVFAGRPGGEVVSEENWSGVIGSFVIRASAEGGAESVVVEVTDHGVVQRLSLVDGTLLDSEVEHIYHRGELDGADAGAALELREERLARHRTEDLEEDALGLEVEAARTAPLTARLGWAEDGMQFLGLHVRAAQSYAPPHSSSQIPLPVEPVVTVRDEADERTYDQVDLENASTTGDSRTYGLTGHLVWFAIPSDLSSARVQLRAEPFPRRSDLEEVLETSTPVHCDLTFSPTD